MQLNDYITIEKVENDQTIDIVAHLKKQPFFDINNDYLGTRNLNILLIRNNRKSKLNNIPVLELGKEFQLKVLYENFNDKYKDLMKSNHHLHHILNKASTDKEKDFIQEAINLSDQIVETAKNKAQESFDCYIDYIRILVFLTLY
ncbi:hypothetical protein [Heyndrickxia camelliae]|uniref:hypothetical protein n=1 Tax=Heyndrickxia camelliae TaxID=1707093 RepID=UPI0010556F7C|nr:hypothetical protein [Heyndrickxia camelliae]